MGPVMLVVGRTTLNPLAHQGDGLVGPTLERRGHADSTLFSNLYSHVTPTMQKEAAAQIGEALFGEG